MNIDHVLIVKRFEREINSLVKGTMNRQLTTKKPNVYGSAMSFFFGVKDHFLIGCCSTKIFFARFWPLDCE